MQSSGTRTANASSRPLRELYWLAGSLALIFLLARHTPLDHAVAALFYDPVARHFPLRDTAFWAVLMHTGLKYLSVAVWFGLLLWWISLRRQPSRQSLRRALGFTLPVTLLAALAVSSLRALSAHSCPWELSLFGGTADYFRFFDAVPLNPGVRALRAERACRVRVCLAHRLDRSARRRSRQGAYRARAQPRARDPRGPDAARARRAFSLARVVDGVGVLRHRVGS